MELELFLTRSRGSEKKKKKVGTLHISHVRSHIAAAVRPTGSLTVVTGGGLGE